jgi:hypothetical protein
MPRHLLENRKGAAERLDADPLPVVGIVVDIGLWRLYQLCSRLSCAGRPAYPNFFVWSAHSRQQPPCDEVRLDRSLLHLGTSRCVAGRRAPGYSTTI